MSAENMDFLENLVNTLDSQGYYAKVVSPVLASGNSIAVMTMPSNDYDHYFDGSYRQGFAFQVLTKHEHQLTAYHALLSITNFLKKVPDIASNNGSYQFEEMKISTSPNGLGKDDKHHLFAAQFSAALFIENKE
ncbi:hypothetical protein [Sutcliffiella halmapala]|uniref:hypothetical protein n=1 Tax=Sutcliffiella halmapala TaxID=79882 RepID=UPI00099496E0|nr:hypothetical protein [Sutcliffiella halmapala]